MERYDPFRDIQNIYSLHFLVKLALALSIIRKYPRKRLENYLAYLVSTSISRNNKWNQFLPQPLDTQRTVSTPYLDTNLISNLNNNCTEFFNLLRSVDTFNNSFIEHRQNSLLARAELYNVNHKNTINSQLEALLSSFHEFLLLKREPLIESLLFGENIVQLLTNISYLPQPQNVIYLRRFVQDVLSLFSFENTNHRPYIFDLFKRLALTSDASAILFYEYAFCTLTNQCLFSSEQFSSPTSQLYFFFLTSNIVELCEKCIPLSKQCSNGIEKLIQSITQYYNGFISANTNPFFSLYRIKISSLALNIYN